MEHKEHHKAKEAKSHHKSESKDLYKKEENASAKEKDVAKNGFTGGAEVKDEIQKESSDKKTEEVVIDFISSLKKSYEEKLLAKESEIEKLKDQLLRLHADFDNARKRMLRDKIEAVELANKGLLEELLPVLDHFQLALKSASSMAQGEGNAKSLLVGFELIHNQLLDVLTKAGLEPFDMIGKPFDPALCEAVATVETNEQPEDTVIEQVRRGYNYKQKLLRAAHVVVAKGKKEDGGVKLEAEREEAAEA